MHSIVKICFVLLSSINLNAAENCAAKSKIYALDTIKEAIEDDWLHENKMESKVLSIEIGQPRPELKTKFPKGVLAGFWVPIKIKAGEELWNMERLFLLGKDCVRNIRAELEVGKQMEKSLKQSEKK